MSYVKPEISIVGEASKFIRGIKDRGDLDPLDPTMPIMAAYDLDE